MKKDIHPNYRPVVFEDASCGFRFLTRSTVQTKKTTKWKDGVEYPLVTVDISSQSHPFYTGKSRLLDAAGRVDKFRRKFGNFAGALKKGDEAEEKPEKKAEQQPEEPKADEAQAEDKPEGKAADQGGEEKSE